MIKKKILLAINSERLENALQNECGSKFDFTKPVTRTGTLFASVKSECPDYVLVADGLIKEFDDKPLLDIIFNIRSALPNVRIIYLMSKNDDDGDDRIAKLIAMGVYDICVAKKIALSTIIDFFENKKDFAYASKLINKDDLLNAAESVMEMDKNIIMENNVNKKRDVSQVRDSVSDKVSKDIKTTIETTESKKEGHLKINLSSNSESRDEDNSNNKLKAPQLVQPQLLTTGKPIKKTDSRKNILETAKPKAKNVKKKTAVTFDYEEDEDMDKNKEKSFYVMQDDEDQYDLSGDKMERVNKEQGNPIKKVNLHDAGPKKTEIKKVEKREIQKSKGTGNVTTYAKVINFISTDRFMENQAAVSVAYILAKQNKKVLYLDTNEYGIMNNLIDFNKGKFIKGKTPESLTLKKVKLDNTINIIRNSINDYDYIIAVTDINDRIEDITLYSNDVCIVIRQKQSIIDILNKKYFYLLKNAIVVNVCFTPALMSLDEIMTKLNNECKCILKIDDSDIINYSATKEKYLTVIKESMTEDYYAHLLSLIR